MQRHKSAEKAARQNEKLNIVNREQRSRIKTAAKQVLAATDAAKATVALNDAFSLLDKGVKTNLIHANKAANKKSQLSKAVSKLTAAK